jgi:Flp pilus assembly secretin CpaC
LIDVFGKNSTVSFNGGTEILTLPQTFITVVPQLNVTVITAKTITLDNLTVTAPGKITALLPVTWNTNYTGNKTLTEKVYYQIDNGPWVLFDTKTHVYDPLTMEYTDFAQLDVTKLPPGIYQIKVYATASDAPDATKTLANPVIVGNRGTTFIKLE